MKPQFIPICAAMTVLTTFAAAQTEDTKPKGTPIPAVQTIVLHEIDHLQGIDVLTESGKDVGEIGDVVLDSSDGSVEYAVIDLGGLLGVGESHRIVPWSSLRISAKSADAPHKLEARTSLTEKQLEAAPKFDKDKRFDADLEKRVRDAAGVSGKPDGRADMSVLVCGNSLERARVKGTTDSDLGEIEKVMLDPAASYVGYVVFASGGALGLGEKHYAMPWETLEFGYNNDGDLMVRAPTLTKDRLSKAPIYDKSDAERMCCRDYVTEVCRFYTVEPYWMRASTASSPKKDT